MNRAPSKKTDCLDLTKLAQTATAIFKSNLDIKANFSLSPRVMILRQIQEKLEQKKRSAMNVATDAGLMGKSALYDLVLFLEQNLPDAVASQAQSVIQRALAQVQPLTQVLSLRFPKISSFIVEGILPCSGLNQTSDGTLHDGVLLTAAQEVFQTWWDRQEWGQSYSYQLKQLNFEKLEAIKTDVKLHFDISEVQVETALQELRRYRRAQVETSISVLSSDLRRFAVIELKHDLTPKEQIDWKADGNSSNRNK